ncbi:thiamine-phosphate kinase [Kangiella geojedonensis]|uniref:Thiamine-monophosphate kinase n=1 Tax=Kangiella geojedonensis TaxID=914150 RepID=A0A0F6TRQ9_9GAMM|nr:thiamine-phosphate kinase [Kangiella geojedonensis]AKE52822.1 Thiamine-monophosphate kinase [Kangiella geojedonensis]
MAEFDLIKQYFTFEYDFDQNLKGNIDAEQASSKSSKNTAKPRVVKGVGDDCAVFDIPNNYQLVTSTDTLVDGVHFFSKLPPELIAHKALAANVSDLAAMGAKPLAFTLSISLPEINEHWLASFSKGLQKVSKLFKIPLVGGDTTQGPLNINITAYGVVKKGRLLERNQAVSGDDIWVTGYLGEAAAALELEKKALGSRNNLTDAEQVLWSALTQPIPPLKFARKLTKLSCCGLDISDGLAADLGHVLSQSQCGAKIFVESLPLSDALVNSVGIDQARQYAVNGGDDYELCFTALSNVRNKVLNLAEQCGVNVTRIGKIIGSGLELTLYGQPFQSSRSSWQHFN